jgi:copper(I)-binding protein
VGSAGKSRWGIARRAGLAGVAAAGLVTAGCTAGQHAQTAEERETLDGTTVQVGSTITLGGLGLATPTDDTSWPSGSSVPIRVVVVNSGQKDDRLTSITSSSATGWGQYGSPAAASAATGGASAAGTSAASPVTIPAHGRVAFGVGETSAQHVLLLTGTKSTIFPGTTVTLTFTFAVAGSKTIPVPVQLTKSAPTSIVPGPSATGEEG